MKRESIILYGLDEQNIAQGLKQQPDIELLNQVETIEQFACWVYHHLFYHCVAESWQEIHGVTTNLMRNKLLEDELIDECLYNRAWFTAVFLQRTWELILVSFDDCIYPQLMRLGLGGLIQTPFGFFGQIIVYESNTGFSHCLKPFYNFQARKQSKIYEAAWKALVEGKPLPEGENGSNPAISLILAVCKAKATRNNPRLRPAFDAFKTSAIHLYDYCAKHYWHSPSHCWNKGHYERGNKDGTYKPLTKLNNRTKIILNDRILL